MAKKVHKIRREQTIEESGLQLRNDNPTTPEEGQTWFNFVDNTLKTRLGSQTRQFAFVGETAGQTLYGTTVSSASELKAAVDSGLNNTIYLRAGTYDLRTLASPGINIEKSIALIGEKTGGNTGAKVKIITDSTRIITASPVVSTITNNNTVAVTNNSTTVTLVGGTWSTSLAGRYFVINGVAYKILANPTTTTLTLSRNYTGPTLASATYYVADKIDTVLLKNLEIVAADSTHNSISFRNIIKPSIIDCYLHTDNVVTMYGRVITQYCMSPIVHLTKLENFKLNYSNDNYNGMIVGNEFVTTNIMGTDPAINLTTNKGTASLDTHFTINDNIFSGPAPIIDLNDATNNIINSNILNDGLNNPINLNGNSFDNIITSNRLTGVTTGGTLIEVNGDWNIVSSNRLTKASGFAISFSATASQNTAIGNRLTGGATINDTVLSNQNRIEDDFSRFGSVPTGNSKDFIDKFNEVLVTLQNIPSGLVQQDSAVNSGVIDESIVYWNTTPAEYQTADATNSAKFDAVGFAKLTDPGFADIYSWGFVRLTNQSNPLNIALFNPTYINERFYLGTSGQLVPESQFTISGVPGAPKTIGTLVDVQGGTTAQFFVNINEDFKYGTPSNTFTLGTYSSAQKSIAVRGMAGNIDKVVFDTPDRAWYVVKDEQSGEITQPFNRKLMANSITGADLSDLVTANSSSLTVYPHYILANGYKKRQNFTSSISPYSAFSGDVFVYSNPTSGIIRSQGYISNSALVASIYNSGSVFADTTLKIAGQYGSMKYSPSVTITPVTTSYEELAKVFVPSVSGTVDLNISASVQAECSLQELFPYQIANIKLQLNGSDIDNSEVKNSLYYVSGETSYVSLNQNLLISAHSSTDTIHEITLYGSYDNGGSTDEVTFSNINLNVMSV